MRKLFWFVVWAVCLWCGFWFFGAYSLENGTRAWLDDQKRMGWAADVSTVETTGFPIRFQTDLTDITLVDPISDLGWKAPEFKYSVQAYRLNQVFLEFANQQRVFTSRQVLDLASASMTAAIRLRANTTLGLDHVQIDLADLDLTSNLGWTSSLQSGAATLTRVADTDAAYDIAISVTDLKLGADMKRAIDPNNRLPDVFQSIEIKATVGFDRPWDRLVLERRRPQPRTIDLKRAAATWGQLQFRLDGDLTIDARGLASGVVTLKATNWQDIVAVLVENGTIPRNMVGLLNGALRGLATSSGSESTLDVPISISNGRMRLGFIDLGTAPRFTIP